MIVTDVYWALGPIGSGSHLGLVLTWVLGTLGLLGTGPRDHFGPGPTWAPGPLGA
jgi:hypothetical protein